MRVLAEQTLLRKLAPSCALVNSQGDIFYLHGRTGRYLEPATGEVSTYNILKMAREGLKMELTTALHKAVHTKETVSCPGLRVKTNSHFTPVDLSVCPAVEDSADPSSATLYLVMMKEGQAVAASEDQELCAQGGGSLDGIVASLKQELKAKEEYLQSANEELETSNEELKSSNEEMQSVNEELQSTNEELETSKEELQSVNEELATVNVELQTNVVDLTTLNNDMNNLLAGTGIATVFVDHQMHILRYTPTANEIINLVKSDVGRPIFHFVNKLVGYESMIADIQAVLDTLIPKEVDVKTTKGNWFTMRILPYRTVDNVIEGAVITFVDITDRKHADEVIKSLLAEKELILREVHHRIKNNMNAMTAILSLQARKMEDRAAVAAFEDAGERMQSMQVLYDMLYQSASFSELSIMSYLPTLVDALLPNFPGFESVTVEKRIDDVILDVKHLQPLGLIVNELLTNSMKYAFTDAGGGHIVVSATRAAGRLIVVVQDDGKGLPESVSFENPSGFGLRLVQTFTKQLQGTIRIERGNGTKVILEFDL